MEQKDSKKLFAMKYINKEACLKQRAVENIVAEVDLLRSIDHPFIVRLWFTFQVSVPYITPNFITTLHIRYTSSVKSQHS